MRRARTLGIVAALGLALAVGATAQPSGHPTPPPAPPDLEAEALDESFALGGDFGMGPGPGPKRRGMERRQAIARELDLTAEQRDKIEAIRDRQQRAAIDRRAKLEIAQLDLRSLLRADKVDRSKVDQQVDAIGKMRSELRKSQIGAMLDMRDVLTPEQRQKLETLRAQGPKRKSG